MASASSSTSPAIHHIPGTYRRALESVHSNDHPTVSYTANNDSISDFKTISYTDFPSLVPTSSSSMNQSQQINSNSSISYRQAAQQIHHPTSLDNSLNATDLSSSMVGYEPYQSIPIQSNAIQSNSYEYIDDVDDLLSSAMAASLYHDPLLDSQVDLGDSSGLYYSDTSHMMGGYYNHPSSQMMADYVYMNHDISSQSFMGTLGASVPLGSVSSIGSSVSMPLGMSMGESMSNQQSGSITSITQGMNGLLSDRRMKPSEDNSILDMVHHLGFK